MVYSFHELLLRKLSRNCLNISILILSVVLTVNAQNEYHYKPYPVLLVHGFNSTPIKTWGVRTDKLQALNNDMLSTKIDSTSDKFKPAEGDKENKFAEELMKSFDQNSNLNDRSNLDYFDYYNKDGNLSEPSSRINPAEEPGSYNGINHSFVETYCAYYAYESDDGQGTKYQSFNGKDINNEPNKNYHLFDGSTYTEGYGVAKYGGQTQLLRIRIIQVLNEYYGDWKWVNDPTAKINIITHIMVGLLLQMH